jgi:hypothetical protein
LSLGKPGLTVNLNREGHKTTVGLPGSGLSYQISHTRWNRHQLARFGRRMLWLVGVALIVIAILFVFQN